MSETPQVKSKWRIQRRILISLATFATLVALFYTEESWRGKRAWDKCKRELEAKGVVLDWNAYIPPPVPDDENFFKAPKMTEWFVRPKSGKSPSSDLTSRLNAGFRPKPCQVAEVIVLPGSTNAPTAENADMVLRYDPFGTVIFSPVSAMETNSSATDFRLPLIQFDDVPIIDGMDNLARQAGISFTLDPKIGYGQPDQNGQIKPEPRLSFRWSNITAKGALVSILNKYNLQLIYDPTNSVARVTTKDAGAPKIHVAPDVHGQLVRLFAAAIGTNTIGVRDNYAILGCPPEDVKPMRIVLESDTTPAANEVRELLAESFPNDDADTKYDKPHISVEADGPDAFRVMLDAVAAADYLAWSDQFEPDFDLIREALKRPYAKIDGDYSIPYEIPIPNFVAVRTVAQVLAQRAKCDLLLGQPDKALQELLLMHDMCRLLEGAPTGKPMTLVSAMINVAVTGLYADIIADGFQTHAWQEPQIPVLQKQLEQINVVSFVVQAFESEPAATTHTLEIIPTMKVKEWFQVSVPGSQTRGKISLWQKIKNLKWILLPRGWIYQNMATIAKLGNKQLDGFDSQNDIIQPQKFGDLTRELNVIAKPYKFFAAEAIPNFAKAWQTTAHNQTMANEAQIACALEGYHLAHGEYPETLNVLIPQFIEKMPHDIIGGEPLHYRRTDDGKFLLYSVGWNETDDGGQVVITKDGSVDREKGDWVWQYPLK